MKESQHRRQPQLTRREFHGLGAAAVAGAVALWLPGRAAADENALASELDDPVIKATLTGIGFVSESTTEGQNCANCQFYTAGEGGRGKCAIIPKGLVPESGWCKTWAAKA